MKNYPNTLLKTELERLASEIADAVRNRPAELQAPYFFDKLLGVAKKTVAATIAAGYDDLVKEQQIKWQRGAPADAELQVAVDRRIHALSVRWELP